MTSRAVTYARVSVDRDDSTSTKAQTAETRRYCKTRGWEIVAEEIDEGISGSKGLRRPGLDRAMELVRCGAVDVFVMHALDRFSRSVPELLELVGEMEQHDVDFAVATQPFDSTTPAGKMTMTILGADAGARPGYPQRVPIRNLSPDRRVRAAAVQRTNLRTSRLCR